MNYTWKITSIKGMDLPGQPNAIIQTFWTKTGTDEQGNEGVFSGATPFSPDDIDPETFVPYDELTEEVVLSWIQALVVGSYEEHVNSQIQKQIDSKRISDKPLPWAPPAE
jgi:hypothetical protein